MKYRLVFQDWQRQGKSIYRTEEGMKLSEGDFHTGTVFPAEVLFDDGEAAGDIERAHTSYEAHPVFLLIPA